MTKKLLIKRERTTDVDGRRIILSKFEKHLVEDGKDFQSQYGILKKADFKKPKAKVGKEEFYIIEPQWIDHYKQIKRIAQIISLKDIGSIIANTGINRESIIMESGTGSAGFSAFVSKLCKKVYSYDINDKHMDIAKKNLENLGVNNVEIKKGDVFKPIQIKEKDIDVFILDMTEPWKAIKTLEKVLKTSGYVVTYNPSISQIQQFVKSLSSKFLYEKTIEVIEREWTIKDKVLRPRMKDLGHTGFLSFSRKISN